MRINTSTLERITEFLKLLQDASDTTYIKIYDEYLCDADDGTLLCKINANYELVVDED